MPSLSLPCCRDGALEQYGFKFPLRQDYEAEVRESFIVALHIACLLSMMVLHWLMFLLFYATMCLLYLCFLTAAVCVEKWLI